MPDESEVAAKLAVVAIGRNEGERLKRCLESVRDACSLVVYVDSGSTDGSPEAAQLSGVEVVRLDADIPFTAARARNAGLSRALAIRPDIEFVQFLDGDTEVVGDWLATAISHLTANPEDAAFSGRRMERFREQSIYNRLCDMEWEVQPGPAKHFGGDVMLRVAALNEVGAYRDDLIAGEEPELSVRLRAHGWKIYRTDQAMTLHDAAMHSFHQWWLRAKRSGYAYIAGAALHGIGPERHWVWESVRSWIWVLGPLGAAILTMPLLGAASSVFLLAYPLQCCRMYLRERRHRGSDAFLWAIFNTLSRFPELLGQWQYLRDRLARRRAYIIEYK